MFCAQCGQPVHDDAKFCVFCGAPIGQHNAPIEQHDAPEEVEAVEVVQEVQETVRTMYSYRAAIILGAIATFLLWSGVRFMAQDITAHNMTPEDALLSFIMLAIPAFVLALVSFIRARKAKRSQGNKAAKVVYIISVVVFVSPAAAPAC